MSPYKVNGANRAFLVRLPNDLYNRLRAYGYNHHRSMISIIREAVKDWLDEHA